jgi:serralysin
MFTDLLDGTSEALGKSAELPLYACNCLLCAGVASGDLQAGIEPQFAVTPNATTSSSNIPLAASSPDIQTLFSGSSWNTGGAKTVITYSFATAASQFSADAANFKATLTEFSAQDKALTRAMLATIEAVCNVSFVEVADSGSQSGQVRYAYSQAPNDMGYAGFAFFPATSATGGDVWIGKAQATSQWDFYRPNLILHETLHAIGLKHPFDGAAVLDTQSNIIANTVMSYSPIAGSSSGSLAKYPGEPMPLDVAALQALYGAASHNAGDTQYKLAEAEFQAGFRALWDSAGNDTLDASGIARAVTLDLRAGARSDIGAQVSANANFGSTQTTTVYTSTLAIAPGADIENATGSAFNDVIVGNALANILSGGNGDDQIDGGAGNDRLAGGNGNDTFFVSSGAKTIDGGAGTDKVVFAGSVSDYVVNQGVDSYIVSSLRNPGAISTLSGVERVEFSDMQLQVRLSSAPPQADALYAQAFRLYQAALDRLPDQEGLIFQTTALAQGASLTQLAANFMSSPEFCTHYGNPGNAEFVTLLYANVLDRAPDAAGLAYHVAHLDAGASRAEILVGFSESPENQAAAQVALVGVAMAGMLYPV